MIQVLLTGSLFVVGAAFCGAVGVRRDACVWAAVAFPAGLAVASLSAGDVESASSMLDELGGPSGDRALDLRIRALRGLVLAEKGEGARALELAEEVRVEAGSDPELRIEARVLKAVALDVLGEREDAIKVMRALGEEMLGVLLVLGLPRVKKLADLALDD